MLSRVAERIYWLARYMERIENTARILDVYSSALLDLPKNAQVDWQTLIHILGSTDAFDQVHNRYNEKHVCQFIITDTSNANSIAACVMAARENARTSREILPIESWELINNLYLFFKDKKNTSLSRTDRQHCLARVMGTAQQLTGLLVSSMSHDHTYDFIVIGRNIERADMTSRIIDVGSSTTSTGKSAPGETAVYGNYLWMYVLRSLNSYQMYRQHVKERVNSEDVVDFLLTNQQLPRSVLHCLNRITEAMTDLPNPEHALHCVTDSQAHVNTRHTKRLLKEGGLWCFIDQLQIEFMAIHQSIADTWFLHSDKAS